MTDVNKVIVSESVGKGHPDKIADFISDSILDAHLKDDVYSRVAVETLVKDNTVVLGGEISSTSKVDITSCVIDSIQKIPNFDKFFDISSINVINLIGKQSSEIHDAVVGSYDINAGDQGFMVGFADIETPNRMPLGKYIADALVVEIPKLRDDIYSDIKSQVIVEDDDGSTVGINSILVSAFHSNKLKVEEVREIITDLILTNKIGLPDHIFSFITNKTEISINPSGNWSEFGGPVSDCGVTGRKIVVDQYGGYCNVGGGAFSGKDFSKVDRTGSYFARFIAKNIVEAGLATRCKVELSYSIGKAKPTSININTYGYSDDSKIASILLDHFNFTPTEMSELLYLNNPYVLRLSYADFSFLPMGGSSMFPWEFTLYYSSILKNSYFLI